MNRKMLAMLLAAGLMLALSLGASAAVYKDEVVYARLLADGQVDSVYVVNLFEADTSEKVSDKGDYLEALPLSDMGDFSYQDGVTSFTMQPGRFSYQGRVAQGSLPWDIRIQYLLDGQPVSPESLSGASGRLEGHLSVAVNEGMKAFADSLSLQITLTLDSDRCFNIQADKATHAVAGGNRTLSFVVLPGQGAEYVFSADVKDFMMAGIQAAGVRMGMDKQMYQDAAAKALAGSPLEAAVGNFMGNFLDAMQGRAVQSYANEGNTVRALQFILMVDGIPEKVIAPEASEAPKADTLWDRILRLFGQ